MPASTSPDTTRTIVKARSFLVLFWQHLDFASGEGVLLQRSDLGDAKSASPEVLATFCQSVCTVYSKTVCVYVLHGHTQK